MYRQRGDRTHSELEFESTACRARRRPSLVVRKSFRVLSLRSRIECCDLQTSSSVNLEAEGPVPFERAQSSGAAWHRLPVAFSATGLRFPIEFCSPVTKIWAARPPD